MTDIKGPENRERPPGHELAHETAPPTYPGPAGGRLSLITDVGVLVAGVWLVVAPFVLGHDGAAFWNTLISGAVIAILAVARLGSPPRTSRLGLVHLVLGIWLIASPFLLGYGTDLVAARTSYATGAVVAVLALASAASGGRSRSVMRD
ncbi:MULTISPECIES: SPW repeat protein [Catenuloplanes]|uniref:SPW repeat-containing integral membrane domain-containing protein n=1 Tax=Catenuloplanes niger TaxID=587534 RepID=A0AAE4A073_9ACTN|nr:SPW repeat protein [Catenuloplanes niger]MDR7327188.1 hypothetical protein [Catenuloplanes niger]